MKIGICDSGIGGLTILKELLEKRPNNEYIYIGDTLNLPYGNKSIKELKKCSYKVMNNFKCEKVDTIIVACGTMSSNLMSDFKHDFKINFIDVISPTIEFLNKSNFKNIGVIGTMKTIESSIFENKLINKNVYTKSLPLLVNLIENSENTEEYLKKELECFKDKNLDILVLGCTHYPLVKKEIEKILNVKTLNMASCILDLVSNNGQNKVKLNFTKVNKNLINNVNSILVSKHKVNKI